MSQQSLRQASFRAIHGGAGRGYNGDAMAAMRVELEDAGLSVPDTYNGRMIAWLQHRLSSTDGDLPGLMAAFAVANGVDRWSSMGSFDPLATEIIDAVAASADDANEVVATTSMDLTATVLNVSSLELAGVRVTPAIPVGATILSAFLRGVSANTTVDTAPTNVQGEAAADAAAFTTALADISGRTLTTAVVSWSIPDFGGGPEETFDSPDLSSIVQEIIDTEGWASGNGMVFVLDHQSGNTKQFAAFDHATLAPMELHARFLTA